MRIAVYLLCQISMGPQRALPPAPIDLASTRLSLRHRTRGPHRARTSLPLGSQTEGQAGGLSSQEGPGGGRGLLLGWERRATCLQRLRGSLWSYSLPPPGKSVPEKMPGTQNKRRTPATQGDDNFIYRDSPKNTQ